MWMKLTKHTHTQKPSTGKNNNKNETLPLPPPDRWRASGTLITKPQRTTAKALNSLFRVTGIFVKSRIFFVQWVRKLISHLIQWFCASGLWISFAVLHAFSKSLIFKFFFFTSPTSYISNQYQLKHKWMGMFPHKYYSYIQNIFSLCSVKALSHGAVLKYNLQKCVFTKSN